MHDDNGNKVASTEEGDGKSGKSDDAGEEEGHGAMNEGKGGKGKGHGDKGVGQETAMSTKRAMAAATRVVGNEESTGNRDAIVTVTRVVGIKEGNDEGGKGNGDGDGNKEGNGNQWQQHGQWRQQSEWQASDGSNNGNGDRNGVKDMAAHAMPGERGVMVAIGHGLCVSFCVCGETTKNKGGPKNSQCVLEQ
jgi:hypothetical protein